MATEEMKGNGNDKATTEGVDHATTVDNNEHVDHEAILTGVVALASLFSNCIEAFNLILPGHKWEKEEQLLLCRIGLQQARLLIWGAVVGITSPPASVTDRAVPKHPSAAYPDIKEPTFFGQRDERLDEPETRKKLEDALSAIVDRASGTTREEMMEKYGLKPPKKFGSEYQPALDLNRLEQFRELWELLREVAETYAQISTARSSSITKTSWVIADAAKTAGFVQLITENIDFLITLMDVKEKVDRGMHMDIKSLGWHLSADRSRIALDISKLRLINDICKADYPEYLPATQVALDNIERERKENVFAYNPYASAMAVPVSTPHASPATGRRGSIQPFAPSPQPNGHSTSNGEKSKRPGLFGGLFKSFGKSSKPRHEVINAGRSQSVAVPSSAPMANGPDESDPPRALSETGPVRSDSQGFMPEPEPGRPMSVGAIMETPTEAVRSKSVGDILDLRPETEEDAILTEKLKLQRLDTDSTIKDDEEMGDAAGDGGPVASAISRHDQFHGLGRQGTKMNW
jgi:hypothetical protein